MGERNSTFYAMFSTLRNKQPMAILSNDLEDLENRLERAYWNWYGVQNRNAPEHLKTKEHYMRTVWADYRKIKIRMEDVL